MQVFSFDNQMKKTGIDMIKAGSVLSLMMFIICLIIYVFNGIEFSMVMILTGFLFIVFIMIGFPFLLHQKDIQFNEDNLVIKPIYPICFRKLLLQRIKWEMNETPVFLSLKIV